MSDVFSEIDLSDNATPTQSNDSPPNLRAQRKNFSLSHKYNSSSPSSTNQINSSLYLNTSFQETTLPPPPLSFLDSNSSISSSFNTPSHSTQYSPSLSSTSPPPTTSSSDSLSPKNLTRSTGSIDLTKRTFNFPISRQDSIIDSLLSTLYERDSSVCGLSSQDSDTVTTGDYTDRSNPRRLSDDSILHDDNTVFSKSNLTHKSKSFAKYFLIDRLVTYKKILQ
jgi:hypothetical protein